MLFKICFGIFTSSPDSARAELSCGLVLSYRRGMRVFAVSLLIALTACTSKPTDSRLAYELRAHVRKGQIQVARAVLERRPHLVHADNFFTERYQDQGFNALHWAAFWGRLDVARLYLKYGAPPDVRGPSSQRPLHTALEGRPYNKAPFKKVLRFFVEAGANVNARDDGGATPLHWAAMIATGDMISVLLDSGADPYARDKEGRTPLHWVAANFISWKHYVKERRIEREDTLVRLLDAGSEVDARDARGRTALLWACRKSRATVVKWLLQYGADPRARDAEGWEPLHHAAYGSNTYLIRLLIDASADVDARTGDGQSAWSVATRRKQSRLSSTVASVLRMYERAR